MTQTISQTNWKLVFITAVLAILLMLLAGPVQAQPVVPIMQIQGAQHTSPFEGVNVTTTGVVTAVALVILLSLRIRQREMETMFKLGCSRMTMFWLQVCELGLILTVSLVVVRVATVGLTMTGLSKDLAQFQALSAFTGSGFTTIFINGLINRV